MKIGIVGSEEAKFTPRGRLLARCAIAERVAHWDADTIVSGECHLGGVDIWAKEFAIQFDLTYIGYRPERRTWTYYKKRNEKIARTSDVVICITVRALPPGFGGMTHSWCYHCQTTDHVKSGGCWTTKYANKLGKIVETIVIDQGDYMARDTMSKTSKVAKQAALPGVAPGAKASRLPVAKSKAKAALAGRGGEKKVALWSDFGDALEDLPALAEEVVSLNKQIAELQASKDVIRGSVQALMEEVKADESWTVRDEGTEWVATYVKPKPGKKLVPELLIQAGVTDKQLAKGYKVVPAKNPFVQVRTKGEKVRDNEEHE